MGTVNKIISKLKMTPHPEGGYYVETYRSDNIVIPKNAKNEDREERKGCSCIYFLLKGGEDNFSAWHRLKFDEIWFFQAGSSLTLYFIDEEGSFKKIKLGNMLEDKDVTFQVFVKAGHWFAAEVDDPGLFTLVNCVVAPGFEFKDFQLASRFELLKQYPKHAEIINKYTRE